MFSSESLFVIILNFS